MNVNSYIKPDWFDQDMQYLIHRTTYECQDKFITAQVIGDAKHRRASVVYQRDFMLLFGKFLDKLLPEIPRILTALAIPEAIAWYPTTEVLRELCDVQLTMYGQGGYFQPHRDNDTPLVPRVARRIVSFVYYYTLSANQNYMGGTLRLYQSQPHDPNLTVFDDINPTNNLLICFDSSILHEVMPVIVPSGKFIDNRFSLNGWLSLPLELA
ncbi:MAG TPA: 2OG-Fe(II) oxygenase [Nitrosopumilaceae archaeon]|jgi:Rps23 Pro-64 3,4-dihydroxylase Tpa1-like proline 4-hydroxylase|nr:2OG-Fe(II) oxygenase [Nitrosopumilaceae archaeon]